MFDINPVEYMMADINTSIALVTTLIFGSVSDWILANYAPIVKLGLTALIFQWIMNMSGSGFATDIYKYVWKIALTLIVATSWAYYSVFVEFITEIANELGVGALNAMTGQNAASMDQAMGEFFMRGVEATSNSFTLRAGVMGILTGLVIAAATLFISGGLLIIIVQSKVMLAVWLGFGGLFIIMLIWGFSSGLFKTFVMQVVNWSIIPMIAYPVASVFLPQADRILATPGIAEKMGQSVVLLVLAFITWVNLKQVPNSVAGVIGGLALGDEFRARQGAGRGFRGFFSSGSQNTVSKL